MDLDYYYQPEAVTATFDYLVVNPDNHPLVVAPTGSGKSHILAQMCQVILERGEKVLVVSHVKEILEQDEEKLVDLLGVHNVGVYSASLKRRERRDVTVAGIQSISKKAYLFEDFKYIIVDEAHLIPKSGKGRYLELFKAMYECTVIGLTATPYRLGTGSLVEGDGKLFDDIVYDIDIVRLIKEGYLSPLMTKDADTMFDTSGLGTRGGDFKDNQMSDSFDKFEITDGIVTELIQYKERYKCWMLFAIDIEHAEHINSALIEAGVDSVVVHSRMSRDDRNIALKLWKEGLYQCIVSVASLTTGVDNPRVDLIGLVRPTKSPVLHVQMIGRGLRIFEDKEHCLVLDFAGNISRLGPINDVTVPVKGKGGGEAPIKTCPSCKTHIPASATLCYICGHEFPREESADLTQKAGELDAVKMDAVPATVEEWHPVKSISYKEYKSSKGESMQVTYVCGLRVFKEWVAIGRDGRPGVFANWWWKQRTLYADHPEYRVPQNPKEAVKRAIRGELNEPISIFVNETGRYPKVTSHKYQSQA